MGKALDIFNKLEVKEFDWKGGKHDIGLIAEEVEKILPEAIWYNNEGKIEGLKPLTLIAVLIEAIKELQEEK